jgi:hypothetical protein
MNNLALTIEQIIKVKVDEVLSQGAMPDIEEYIPTDNLGEVIEKLVILHIRTWMLEDAAQMAATADELAEIKRKVDICFKQKRPKFVQAINRMVDDAIIHSKSLAEDSVKLYKGVE